MKKSKPVSILFSVLTALLMLSFSVAMPLLVRPFYYAQISPLRLEAQSGLTTPEIREAFDDVMDFCLGKRPDFAAGVLPFSESGASHFADVKVLFLLDLRVLGISAILTAALLAFCRLRRLEPYRFLGHRPYFWSAAGLTAVFAVIGVLGAIDFDRLFTVFHTVFFPGKTNWYFDPWVDPVILILPERFFANCAILIGSVLILLCAVCLIADKCSHERKR